MKSMSYPFGKHRPTKCLLKILNEGGQITRAPNRISCMRNGLSYYCLEVNINDSNYCIQAFQNEAIDLYNTIMTILGENIIPAENEKVKTKGL